MENWYLFTYLSKNKIIYDKNKITNSKNSLFYKFPRNKQWNGTICSSKQNTVGCIFVSF